MFSPISSIELILKLTLFAVLLNCMNASLVSLSEIHKVTCIYAQSLFSNRQIIYYIIMRDMRLTYASPNQLDIWWELIFPIHCRPWVYHFRRKWTNLKHKSKFIYQTMISILVVISGSLEGGLTELHVSGNRLTFAYYFYHQVIMNERDYSRFWWPIKCAREEIRKH